MSVFGVYAEKLVEITPDDDNDLATPVKALYIGADGDIEIIAVGDTTSVTMSVLAGAILPIRVKKVLATGTTATGIVGMV